MRRIMTAACIVVASLTLVYCKAIMLPQVLSAGGVASARADDPRPSNPIPETPATRARTDDEVRRAEEAKLAITRKDTPAGDAPVPHGPGQPNNVCQQAFPISDGTQSFSTIGATTDGPPLQPGCDTATQAFNDVWFNYIASCTGTVTVSTCGTANFDTVIAIYNSCACPLTPLQQIGCDDDTAGCSGNTSTATASVIAGQCYKIRIGGFSATSFGSGAVTVSCNTIGGNTGACCQSSGGCTPQTAADCSAQGGFFLGAGVLCTPSSCGGACCAGNGTCFQATSLDHCGGLDGRTMSFNTTCGMITCANAITNDYVFAAAPLPEPPATASANIVMAREDEILACGPGVTNPGLSVWYSIVGTGHTLTASTCNPGTTFDTQVEIFCGPRDNLTCVGGNDDAAGSPPECSVGGLNRKSRVAFCSEPGKTYFISVSGWGSSFGTFELTITSDGVTCGGAVSCPVSTPLCLACPGDMNNDSTLNGTDISPMVDCMIEGGGAGCGCGDLNNDRSVTPADLPPFVGMLLAGSGPPCYRNMEFNTQATVVLQVDNPPLGLVALSLNNAGEGDTRVRFPDAPFVTGQPVPLEMHLLELVGEHPVLGEVRLHQNRELHSFGSIENVIAGPGGTFLSGDVRLNVFFTLEIQNPQYATAANNIPLNIFSPGNTMLPPNQPLTSEQPVPLTFNPPTITATVVSVTHSVQKMCIYQVTCIDGPCNDCPVRLGDIVACFNCVNTCAGFQRKCGTKNCCVTYSVIDCRPPSGEPPCPPGDFCPVCNAATGKCCLPDGGCIEVTESTCKDLAGPGGYRGDGTSCGPARRCCMADGSCIDTDPECCIRAGGTPAPGTCAPPQRCCIGNDTCRDLDPQCCALEGGMSLPGTCQPVQRCCLPSGICVMTDPVCCVNVLQGQSFPGACNPQKCCLGNGSCVDRDPQCCQLLGGVTYAGVCNPQRCCLPNGNCVDRDPDCCQQIGGTPMGPGLCQPLAACCFDDGDCQEFEPQCCVLQGGTPHAGANCINTGGCCKPDNTCIITTLECCQDLGGTFGGAGSNCTDERCCLPSGACVNLSRACCLRASGNPSGPGACAALRACCFNGGICQMREPECCQQQGGQPQPAGSTCAPVNPCACCVGPACAPNAAVAPTYAQVAGGPANCGGNFGLTRAGFAGSVTGTFTACCNGGNNWQIRAQSVNSDYTKQVCDLGRTIINTGNEATVTNDNCAAIIADFTAPGANGAAPYATYVSLTCVTVHEDTHVAEWRTSFNAAWVAEEPVVEALNTNCVVPAVDTPEEAVAALQAQINASLNNARLVGGANWPDDPPGTSGAYAAENGCLGGVIAAIRARGFANCPP